MAVTMMRKITSGFTTFYVFIWDNALYVLNLVLPKRRKGKVVTAGSAGHHGTWPAYVPPKSSDSRSPCPMLNALSNHAILPRDGKDFSFRDLTAAVQRSFNFAPTFCFFASHFAAEFLERPYSTGRLDLADLGLHADNAIEHDGSLTRQDVALVPDQSRPDQQLVDALLAEATGTMPDGSPRLTVADLTRALSKRRADARKTNPQYSETWFHNFFGSANSSTMLTIFDGSIADLTPMLKEERFPDGWEPRVLDHYGLTMAKFNALVMKIERGIDEKKYS